MRHGSEYKSESEDIIMRANIPKGMGGGPGNMQAMLRQAQKMQEDAARVQQELEEKEYENVLVACHGGIIRALCGYLENRRSGIVWRPKPRNCEFRVYRFDGQHYTRIR